MVARTLCRSGLLGAALLMAACAPTRSVTVRVTDEAGRPVHGASIIAIPIATTDIPLPVTLDTISQALAQKSLRESGVTDERGDARLTLLEHPTAVRVSPAPFDPLADSGAAWLFTLDPMTGQVDPPRDRANPPGLTLIVAP